MLIYKYLFYIENYQYCKKTKLVNLFIQCAFTTCKHMVFLRSHKSTGRTQLLYYEETVVHQDKILCTCQINLDEGKVGGSD